MRPLLCRVLLTVVLAVCSILSPWAEGVAQPTPPPAAPGEASGQARPGAFSGARISPSATPQGNASLPPAALYPPPETVPGPAPGGTLNTPAPPTAASPVQPSGGAPASAPPSPGHGISTTGSPAAGVPQAPAPSLQGSPGEALRPRGGDSPSRIVRPVLHPDAFEEALGAPLELTVRQVDTVLLEAMQQCGIPVENLSVVDVGPARGAADALPGRLLFQRLSIRLDGDPAALHQALEIQLARQVPRALLETPQDTVWRIKIIDRLTHEILLTFGRAPDPVPTPTQPPGGARLAIVIDDMGASLAQARELLAVDAPVVFSILPYTEHAAEVAQLAHASGREVMVHLPMEPVNSHISPGRDALRVGMDAETIARLTRVNLDGVPHAVGVNNHMGSRFTQQEVLVRPALEVIKGKGLFLLDSLTHERSCLAKTSQAMGVPTYRRDVFLDVVRDATTILHQIRKAEHLALQHGQAIAIGHPYPETFEALRRWERSRRQGVIVVGVRQLETLRGTASVAAPAPVNMAAPVNMLAPVNGTVSVSSPALGPAPAPGVWEGRVDYRIGK